MTEDFKAQLKEYLSGNLELMILSFCSRSNEEVVKIEVLLEGDVITSDSFTVYQNYEG